jgi:PPOX class probable F420-dependent enzyme
MTEAHPHPLLARRGLLGVVGTRRADSSPRAVPVWFRFDGHVVWIWTDERRRWVRDVQRHARVSFSVHENERPWTSVVIRGDAAIVSLSDEETMTEIRRISERYLDAAEIEDYVAAWPETRTLVRIEPASFVDAQAFEDPTTQTPRGL